MFADASALTAMLIDECDTGEWLARVQNHGHRAKPDGTSLSATTALIRPSSISTALPSVKPPSPDAIARIGAAHRRFGATGRPATPISGDLDAVGAAIGATHKALADGSPGLLSLHIEGPFLDAARKSIHDASKFRVIDEAAVALLTSLNAGRTLVTLAPETATPDIIQRLTKAGVIVAAGHSTLAETADVGALRA